MKHMSEIILQVGADVFESVQEAEQAYKYTFAQVKGFQHLIKDVMNEKLSLSPEHGKEENFFRQSEYLRGQLDILKYLLSTNNS